MIKAVIFDFDGVIVETERQRFDFLKKQLERHGHELKAEHFSQLRGISTKSFLKKVFGNKLSENFIEQIKDERYKDYHSRPGLHITKVPGLESLLKSLQEKGIAMAIASASRSSEIKRVLEFLDLSRYFRQITGAEETEKHKPEPDLYLIALRKLKLKPEQCIVIEDSAVGVEAAKAAGMKVIAITTTHERQELKKADRIISAYQELKDLSFL